MTPPVVRAGACGAVSVVLLAMLGCTTKAPAPTDGPYDLVITNGRIVDGTGNPFY